MLGGNVPLYWFNTEIDMSSMSPKSDGTIEGHVHAYGGFFINGSWESPVESPAEGIRKTSIDLPANEFILRIDAKIAAGEKSVLAAIKSTLEDVYREQNPE